MVDRIKTSVKFYVFAIDIQVLKYFISLVFVSGIDLTFHIHFMQQKDN